jgi:hypothetical protein
MFGNPNAFLTCEGEAHMKPIVHTAVSTVLFVVALGTALAAGQDRL